MSSQLDFERCYRAVESRDARFDGWFITAVTTTGIYCRPSCPTPVRPKRANVRFYPTAAAAQLAGFRACKRCRPDASPGSPEWNVREVFALAPTELRKRGRRRREVVEGALTLRLPYRQPFDWPTLFAWLRARALPGVADARNGVYRRTLRLPRGAGIATLEPVDAHI